jgi:hypothetical protein
VTFSAVAESVVAVRPVEYVAAGATVAWMPQVNVIQDGAPAAGMAVSWTASSGMTVAGGLSVVSGLGVGQIAATVGPLAAGVQASGQACAWGGVQGPAMCAGFSAVGVDPANWRLTVVSGAGQAVALAGMFAPVVLMVTDVAGHPVAGAAVAIHQTVDMVQMACPARGACTAAPVLGAADGMGVSDVNGLVSVTPMQMAGMGGVTNIAVAAGTQGFVSLSIERGP